MSFTETAEKFLDTIKKCQELPISRKGEAYHMMNAYEAIMKDDCARLCVADLPYLLRLTETNQVVNMKDIELVDILFRHTIEYARSNELVIANYSEFLNIHGWDLESIQLKTYLAERKFDEIQTFLANMTTFYAGKPINQFSAPGALTAFQRGELPSAFSYIAKQYLDHIRHNLDSHLLFHKTDNFKTIELHDKLKLFVPCIAKCDLEILHEFTVNGLAAHLPDHQTAFAMFEKNMTLEPDNFLAERMFYKMLANLKKKRRIS